MYGRLPYKLPKVLPRKDVAKFLNAIDVSTNLGLRDRIALELMYGSGLRVSEVCNLPVPDICLEPGEEFVYVQQSKNGRDRMVPLDHVTANWCRRWADVRPPDAKWFICTMTGTRLSERHIRKVCYRLSHKSGVYLNDNLRQKPVHPHTLRHCCATEMLENNIDIRKVQEYLGHTNIQTTMIYTHVRPKALALEVRARRRK